MSLPLLGSNTTIASVPKREKAINLLCGMYSRLTHDFFESPLPQRFFFKLINSMTVRECAQELRCSRNKRFSCPSLVDLAHFPIAHFGFLIYLGHRLESPL